MPSLRTVADTCSLVSLAIPLSHQNYDHQANPDPLYLFLSTHTVTVPTQVVTELKQIAQYNDLDGAAASNILNLSGYYTQNPLNLHSTPNSLPSWGQLDDGETASILLANADRYDFMISDEFTNRGEITSRLSSPQWLTTPDLLVDFAGNGIISTAEARQILSLIEQKRSWQNQPYVQRIKRNHLNSP